jgi:hypothetical protein
MASSASWLAALDPTDPTLREYLRFHRQRYQILMEKVRACARRLAVPPRRVLDVGMSFQTALLRQELPDAIVDTLGYEDGRFKEDNPGQHYCFDLNKSADPAQRPELPPYDLIVMAEVIEHLMAPPRAVLESIAGWLRPQGELLLQTPNAVSLAKRLRMLRGYNPFMMPQDPAALSTHFREYTVAELIELGREAGLEATDVAVLNYFAHESHSGRLYQRFGHLIPAGLRDGITISFRKL